MACKSATVPSPMLIQTPGQTPVQVNVSQPEHGMKIKSGAAFYGLVFLIVFIIAFFIFYLLKPAMVMKKVGDRVTEEVDFVKILIASLITALIIVLLAWIFRTSIIKSL